MIQSQNPPLTSIQQHALERIHALEERIHEKYGLRVCCGIEMEFYYRNPSGDLPEHVIPLQNFDTTDVSMSRPKTASNSFVQSNYVQRLYKEAGGGYKYELVLGRKLPLENERDIKKFRSSMMALAAKNAKHLIEKRTPELLDGNVVRFMPVDPKIERATAGTHINVSLWDDHTDNVLGANPHYMKELLKSGLEVQKSLFPLLVESELSLKRFGKNHLIPTEFVGDFEEKYKGPSIDFRIYEDDTKKIPDPNLARLEHRLPGADADPFLATLIAVGGLWRALERGVQNAPPTSLTHKELWHQESENYEIGVIPHSKIPRSLEAYGEMLQDWDKDKIAKEILGDTLFTEIKDLRMQQYQEMSARSRIADIPEQQQGLTSWARFLPLSVKRVL